MKIDKNNSHSRVEIIIGKKGNVEAVDPENYQ